MHVVFVAPLWRPNTLRYVAALADLPGLRVSLLTKDHPERLAALAPRLAARMQAIAVVQGGLDGPGLTEAARRLQKQHGRIDRILGALEELQLPIGMVRSALAIPGMSAEVAHNFRDKARMKEVLRAAGLPVARHQRLTRPEEARAFAARVGFPLVLKPVAGVGARSTYRVSNTDELAATLRTLRPSPGNPVQAEEFVTGTERTLEAVLIDGEPVWWSGTRYAPTPLQTLEHPWMQYTVTLPAEATSPWTDFLPTSIAALQALGLKTGLSHME